MASALLSSAAPAFAESGAVRLEVTRAPGSGVCPNAGGIVYTAAKLFPDMPLRLARPDDGSAPRIEIAVEPVDGGHSAVLRSSGGERKIVDWDVQCRGLGEALAVALVVWVAPPAASPPPSPATPAGGSASKPAASVVWVCSESRRSAARSAPACGRRSVSGCAFVAPARLR
jgi:hypothetical protein